VLLVESASGIGQGVSSRNSEVIHGGLYYTPGSAKARLCVRGKQLLYALCESHGVAHRACGKLVVATDESQHAALRTLQEKARLNGCAAEWWSATQARAREPALQCTAALWSPSTGIVDSHGLMLALQGDLERAGGLVALQSKVHSLAAQREGGLVVRVSSADGDTELLARRVVNAAGLWAVALAQQVQGLDAARLPRARFAKGSYFSLSGAAPFGCLVYPAPVDAWLGVHLTLDLGGQARFGPDLEWLDALDPDGIDYAVDPARAAGFAQAIRRYWPALPDGALQPAYSGVRPKIHEPGTPAPDYRIDGPAAHGVPGLVNLLGIESPGLTSSMAIAEEVVALLAD
jgi:L-2-hydroxyglutarate oxidase LhgO